MKKIVNGVTYNTETSTQLAKSVFEDVDTRSRVESRLYQTRGGAFFVDEEETKSVWVERLGEHQERIDNTFRPLSGEEAHKWMLEGEVEVYHNPFDEPPEATAEPEPGATIYIRVPASLKKLVDDAARAENVSGNVWAMRCVQQCVRNASPPEWILKDPYPNVQGSKRMVVLPIAEGMPVVQLSATAATRLGRQLLEAAAADVPTDNTARRHAKP